MKLAGQPKVKLIISTIVSFIGVFFAECGYFILDVDILSI